MLVNPYGRGRASGAFEALKKVGADYAGVTSQLDAIAYSVTVDTIPAIIKPLESSIINVRIESPNASEVIVRSGKNQFDSGNPVFTTGLYIQAAEMIMKAETASHYGCVYVPILHGITYTISKAAGASFRVGTSTDVPVAVGVVINQTTANHAGTSITITSGETDNYLIIMYYADTTDTGTTEAALRATLQVEVSANATAYEQFVASDEYVVEVTDGIGGVDIPSVAGTNYIICSPSVMACATTYNPKSDYVIDQLEMINARVTSEVATLNLKNGNRSFSGKKWLVIGDSISEENYRADINYHKYIAEWLGITVVNVAASGTGYIHPFNSVPSWLDRVSTFPLDVDFVTVMGALNDREHAVGAFGDTTSDTLYGGLKLFYDAMIAKYPNIPIGVITSTPREYCWGENGQYVGHVNAVIEMARHYSLPLLDLYRVSGFRPYNADNKLEYFSCEAAPSGDGVHPNTAGQLLMAYKILDFVTQYLYA